MFKWYKKAMFENYANFNGRARRSEYWYFVLMNFIILIVAAIIDKSLGLNFGALPYGYVYGICALATLIPGLAVGVRRLHDVGKSGWLYALFYISFTGIMFISGTGTIGFPGLSLLLKLIVLFYAVWILVLFCKAGQEGENKFGSDPKGFGDEIDGIGIE